MQDQDVQRIVVIGAGHVGATAAYALMLRGLFRQIVLIDSDPALAKAQAADLADADALARPAQIWAGTYADAAGAQIAVITAGAATHGSETRLSVASRSAAIVRECATALCEHGFNGIILVAANPVDLMAMVAFEASNLPAAKVIGTGTLLDSARLRQALATHLGVAPTSIEAMVLGEHGDSEVALFSSARIGGAPLATFPHAGKTLDTAQIADDVRCAGYAIIEGKGYTSFGIATALVRICEAIIRDERVVLPVSTQVADVPGIGSIHISRPCVIGASGVEQVVLPSVSEDEQRDLDASARTIWAAWEELARNK